MSGGEVVVEGDYVLESVSTLEYVATSTGVYRCDDDGMWLLSSRWEYSFIAVADGQLYEGWTQTTYDSYMAMPADVGSGWRTQSSALSEDHLGNETPSDVDATWTLSASTEVTVPAGSFDVTEFIYSSGDYRASSWMNERAGLIKSESSQLIERSR
ncbi:MAG: hypothetical protein ACI9MC_001228 [Kiritimatiellia bacterium]|jgi:hypothetical protein